ncbi:hypothetical protein DUI87_13556 [Hirundo rustica rustica]|uniref:Uncharacterized protein n=1 Tax=Hirundo rustica rustica TaxID=333673 RepID=A0A3M0K9C7_HIRRU|nr:hypothetical protein DUI87_13556 [Hirundo rustica rustica]
MKLIRVSPECCDKCLSTCLEFRLKIEGCAIRGYDIDFNITQVCTEYHKNPTKITPPVPRKAVITKMPAIPEVEEQITPVVTKIGPYAIKKTGVQKLIVNPKWSLKRVEMGVQVNASHVRPECAPFLRNSFMDWTTWLQKSMPPNFRNKRDLTGLLGTGLGVLNTIDSEVLLNKLTTIGSDLVKLQQPLQSSLLALGNNHWKLTKILPEWEDTEERDHEAIINALGTASENISLALGCTQAQLCMQSVAAAVIREGGAGIFPAEIRKIVWDNASDMERELQSCEAKTPAVAAVKRRKKGKKHIRKTDRPVDDNPGKGPSMPPDTKSEAEPNDTNQGPNQLTQDRESDQVAQDQKPDHLTHDQKPNQLAPDQEPNQLAPDQEPNQLVQDQKPLLSPFP